MATDGVSTAFQIILEEIDSVVGEVNSQGAAFIRNNDYPKAEAAISAGKKLAAFRMKLEELRNEWVSGLDETTRLRVQVQPAVVSKSIAAGSKASKTILIVRFADGSIIFEPKAADTFAKTLAKFGLSKVAALNLKVNNFPLVSKSKSESYSQTEIQGYLVMTHSSTEAKRDKLLEIASSLGVSVSVDIVPAAEA